MSKIKIKWGGNRHDIKLHDTDHNFQKLLKALKNLKGITTKLEGKHDWGIGIPSQDSGYDLELEVFEKTGWVSKRKIAVFEIRLDARKESQKYVRYEAEKDPDNKLPAILEVFSDFDLHEK